MAERGTTRSNNGSLPTYSETICTELLPYVEQMVNQKVQEIVHGRVQEMVNQEVEQKFKELRGEVRALKLNQSSVSANAATALEICCKNEVDSLRLENALANLQEDVRKQEDKIETLHSTLLSDYRSKREHVWIAKVSKLIFNDSGYAYSPDFYLEGYCFALKIRERDARVYVQLREGCIDEDLEWPLEDADIRLTLSDEKGVNVIAERTFLMSQAHWKYTKQPTGENWGLDADFCIDGNDEESFQLVVEWIDADDDDEESLDFALQR